MGGEVVAEDGASGAKELTAWRIGFG